LKAIHRNILKTAISRKAAKCVEGKSRTCQAEAIHLAGENILLCSCLNCFAPELEDAETIIMS